MNLIHKSFEEWRLDNPKVKEIECPVCEGTGYEECPHCGQDMECEECYGTGYTVSSDDIKKRYENECKRDEERYKAYLERMK